jgi:hypothetical protein
MEKTHVKKSKSPCTFLKCLVEDVLQRKVAGAQQVA